MHMEPEQSVAARNGGGEDNGGGDGGGGDGDGGGGGGHGGDGGQGGGQQEGPTPSAAIYTDGSGRLYVASTVPLGDGAYELRPLFDAECASVVNRPAGAPPGTLVASGTPPAPPALPTVFADPAVPRLVLRVGRPFPIVRYGQLLAARAGRYVVELDGARQVPDDATLAAKGYAPGDALGLRDEDFELVRSAPAYLPVSPSAPVLVHSAQRAELYLYSRSSAGTSQRQLLIGRDTLAVYRRRYPTLPPVAQSDIDTIAWADPPRIEEFFEKILFVDKIKCLKQAHRSVFGIGGGDDLQLKVGFDPSSTTTPWTATGDTLLWSGHLGNDETAAPNKSVRFAGLGDLRLFIGGADDFTAPGEKANRRGFLYCPDSDIWFDTERVDAGAQVLVFKASTGGLGDSWTVEYQLTVRVEYAPDFGVVSVEQLPNNAYRIKHFIMVMMENRSFDYMFGGNDTLQQQLTFKRPSSVPSVLADKAVDADLGHEIDDTLAELLGPEVITADNHGVGSYGVIDQTGRLVPPLSNSLSAQHFADGYQAKIAATPNAKTRPEQAYASVVPGDGRGLGFAVNQLAEEFHLFETWHASVPGPTWPNRFFAHCGTSGSVYVSPDGVGGGDNTAAVVDYVTGKGFRFANGSIFDRLTALGVPWRVYHSGFQTQVWAVQGMSPIWNIRSAAPLLWWVGNGLVLELLEFVFDAKVGDWLAFAGDLFVWLANLAIDIALVVLAVGADPITKALLIVEAVREVAWLVEHVLGMFGVVDAEADDTPGLQRDFDKHFADDMRKDGYVPFYTFIEPDQTSNSGHPPQDESVSEHYLATLYEAVRNSPMWARGEVALVLLYDEHGGFWDHVPPPQSPGMAIQESTYRTLGDGEGKGWAEQYHDRFDGSLLGLRVPAIVMSRYTQRTSMMPPADAAVYYDHSSFVRTLQRRLGDRRWLTPRVANARDMFDAFGVGTAGDDRSSPTLTKYKPAPPPPPPRPTEPRTPLELAKEEFHAARAAEIRFRCDVVGDAAVRAEVNDAIKRGATPAARMQSLRDTVAAQMARYHGAEAAAELAARATPGLRAKRATDVNDTLEGYRGNLARFGKAWRSAMTTRSARDRLGVVRAQLVAAGAVTAPSGPWPDGVLLKGSGDPVYIIVAGRRRWIPDPVTFGAMGCDWAAIWPVDDATLGAVPDGGVLPARTDGMVLGADGAVCVILHGTRHALDAQTLAALHLDSGAVKQVAAADLAAIPDGGAVPSLGGLATAPATVDFGAVRPGATSNASLLITNSGASALALQARLVGSDAFTPPTATVTVPPSGRATLALAFTPPSTGAISASLTLDYATDYGAMSHTVALTGTGVVPAWSASPSELTLAAIGAQHAGRVTVTNESGAALTVATAVDGDGFAVLPASLALAPGASGTVTVTFASTDGEGSSGTLTLSGGGTQAEVALTGLARRHGGGGVDIP